ncbi:high affinity cAMP-specific 3',5'-cyclic phosphodiesterase 7A isoform X3 [Lingula anatina]|uniref:Phosphodiesterase n=1 Tax=Lingula anatina TaxID=7574 RepID=A0A1S3J2W7_LINAN|nr:high affinity cAMP-specific 3',5'-cyclic phosphodiesterase 7A isoform X3 [Lingula anatina]|eukprot:XP_013404762.1 high affinity cAMP-specific 3',5'-cyclic phosphodiesterase 7A isoform X3 [Lingula anatina]
MNIQIFQRRGGISFERTDQNALYVRMLGDVKVQMGIGEDHTSPQNKRRRSSDPDFQILDNLDGKTYRSRCSLRFLTLHKGPHKRRSILRVSKETASILDHYYNGPAKCLLHRITDWNFNIFSLDSLTSGRALYSVAFHLFHKYKLIQCFHLDVVKVMRCLSLIEDGYHSSNPYHNAVHAADVTQAMNCFLVEQKIAYCYSQLEILVGLLAAMCHDVDHPGVNQSFLIATSNHLASLYQNTSVLENHHWRTTVGILHESGMLSHLNARQWHFCVRQLKSLILATDITRQQEFLSKFKKHNDHGDLQLDKEEHRHFVMQIALKCADISNPCRPLDISRKWSQSVCEEFFKQGDCERDLQLPVTPVCDRNSTTVAKIQIGFMDFVVGPLFSEWQRFIPSNLSKQLLNNINLNRSYWLETMHEPEADLEEGTVSKSSDPSPAQSPVDNISFTFDAIDAEGDTDSKYGDEADDDDDDDELPMLLMPAEIQSLLGARRHSMPPALPRRDVFKLQMRRESYPICTSLNRRGSLPKTVYQSTSWDQLSQKLSKTSNGTRALSLDTLTSRPKISVLSALMDTVSITHQQFSNSDPQSLSTGTIPVAPTASKRLWSLPHCAVDSLECSLLPTFHSSSHHHHHSSHSDSQAKLHASGHFEAAELKDAHIFIPPFTSTQSNICQVEEPAMQVLEKSRELSKVEEDAPAEPGIVHSL